ncbi:Ribosome biogenesis protein brx1 [Tilletia horrida]|uniref:Ribosome biogenesis protein brx1 n=1 Tax=Tilletia horrida TaxID=155126 RepID=A0AAN6JTN6_9BASI|nr:Ribosome biogenesis protein brx1 [Tilletia horrida]KAK0564917.1 Ribosome biogenesis protein brx1 [Tilletia horrida]
MASLFKKVTQDQLKASKGKRKAEDNLEYDDIDEDDDSGVEFDDEEDDDDEDEEGEDIQEEEVEDDEADKSAAAQPTGPAVRVRQKVLILPSRGVTTRMRHLVNDIEALLPHSKKESKLDSKSDLHILNELAELNNCNNVLYFEARKAEDLYLWAAKTPNGPSVKFYVQNIHTMDELKMTGNCLKGSRPLLTFDSSFDTPDSMPHWTLVRELFTHIFSVPKGARKSKPFVDRVMSFSILDGKVWIRNFQIVENHDDGNAHRGDDEEDEDDSKKAKEERKAEVEEQEKQLITAKGAKGADEKQKKRQRKAFNKNGRPDPKLVEIGPRMVLTPIKIFEGAFGGATLYDNAEYISPNAMRHAARRVKGQRYADRTNEKLALQEKRQRHKPREDALSNRNVFA